MPAASAAVFFVRTCSRDLTLCPREVLPRVGYPAGSTRKRTLQPSIFSHNMPYISHSTYHPPLPFRQGHINTVFAALGRRLPAMPYIRERWDTPDGDFLDVDWAAQGNSRRVLLALHGMEGDTSRPYVRGILRAFAMHGWDALSFNFRGCSGESNRLPRAYHMGETGDLDFVLHELLQRHDYDEVALVGFSLGGNVLLKYLGEQGRALHPAVKKAVAFSVPCHIPSSERAIARPINRPYVWRFLRTLNPKMQRKAALFPGLINAAPPLPRSLREFDERFTAPLHGFAGAEDYWQRSSSLPWIEKITVPTLLVNAQDDSFLSPQCFPRDLAERLPDFYLETPRYGGHVGFVSRDAEQLYWSERRALEFCGAG